MHAGRTALGPAQRVLPWLVPLLLIGGIFLSAAWDADGSVATTNLPQVTLESVASVEQSTRLNAEEPERDNERAPRSYFGSFSRLRRLAHLILEQLWRPVAQPARGP